MQDFTSTFRPLEKFSNSKIPENYEVYDIKKEVLE